MNITQRQKVLIDRLDQDQNNSDTIYKPGPYWSFKSKKSKEWIIKNGFKDFRGLNSPVGTSYADNLILDKRNEFGFNIKSRILKKITNLPIIKRLYENQVKLTKSHIDSYLTYRNYIFQNSERVKYLLSKYKIKDSTLFDSVKNFKYNNEIYACLYLENLDKIDEINKLIDFKNVKSVFEIGGGFGSNIHILLQNFENIKKVIYLDISPNIFIGTEYLRHFYNEAVIDYLDSKDKEIKFSNNDKLEIFCITPWQLPKIKSKIDYFHNAHSFQEMTPSIIKNYSTHINNLLNDKGFISLALYINNNIKIVQIDEIINIFDKKFNKIKLPEFFRNNQNDYILLIHQKTDR